MLSASKLVPPASLATTRLIHVSLGIYIKLSQTGLTIFLQPRPMSMLIDRCEGSAVDSIGQGGGANRRLLGSQFAQSEPEGGDYPDQSQNDYGGPDTDADERRPRQACSRALAAVRVLVQAA